MKSGRGFWILKGSKACTRARSWETQHRVVDRPSVTLKCCEFLLLMSCNKSAGKFIGCFPVSKRFAVWSNSWSKLSLKSRSTPHIHFKSNQSVLKQESCLLQQPIRNKSIWLSTSRPMALAGPTYIPALQRPYLFSVYYCIVTSLVSSKQDHFIPTFAVPLASPFLLRLTKSLKTFVTFRDLSLLFAEENIWDLLCQLSSAFSNSVSPLPNYWMTLVLQFISSTIWLIVHS